MNWLVDTHTHSNHSFDGKHSVLEMAQTAEKMGMQYYAITDHLEFEYEPWNHPFDPAAQRRDVEQVQQQVALKLAYGAEIGLTADPIHAQQGWDHIKDHDPDVVIGSLHILDGVDVYHEPFFVGRSREQAYIPYIENILAAIKTLPQINILGHYDFVCKGAPYDPRPMTLADSPAAFDELFTYIIQQGIGLEINTAVWKGAEPWGLDVLKYYREKGGEFVTFGTDSHRPSQVGLRIDEARELALAAGINYTAVYEKRKPIFIKL